MAYYVDVILPIPVNQKFTYIISKDEYDFIKNLNADLAIVVAYGQIIPKEFLSLTKKLTQIDYEKVFYLCVLIKFYGNWMFKKVC